MAIQNIVVDHSLDLFESKRLSSLLSLWYDMPLVFFLVENSSLLGLWEVLEVWLGVFSISSFYGGLFF